MSTALLWNSLSLTYGVFTLVLLIYYKSCLFTRVVLDLKEEEKLKEEANASLYRGKAGHYHRSELNVRVNALQTENVDSIPIDMLIFYGAYTLLQWQNASGKSGDIETLVLLIAVCLYTFSRLVTGAFIIFFHQLEMIKQLIATLGDVSIIIAVAIMVDSAAKINFNDIFSYLN